MRRHTRRGHRRKSFQGNELGRYSRPGSGALAPVWNLPPIGSEPRSPAAPVPSERLVPFNAMGEP